MRPNLAHDVALETRISPLVEPNEPSHMMAKMKPGVKVPACSISPVLFRMLPPPFIQIAFDHVQVKC